MSTDPTWDEPEAEYAAEEYGVEEGCIWPATTDRIVGVTEDGDILTEMVCEDHELVYSYDEDEWEEVGFFRGLWRVWRAFGWREVVEVFKGGYRA
ncbi:hypothetical protein ACXJJ3_32865 [Kribbella sp. WER1]